MNPALPISLSCTVRSRPWLQSLALPFETLAAIALNIIGRLAGYLGAAEASRKILFEAAKLENRCATLLVGLLTFGTRFLVYSDNHGRRLPDDLFAYQEKGYCRGAVYWMALKALRSRASLIETAREFEKGVPEDAANIHEMVELPPNLGEERIAVYAINNDWDEIDELPREGVFSVRVGCWGREMQPLKSHRILFFRGEAQYLFDPALGLAEFNDSDWIPQIKRVSEMIDQNAGGFFTVECFRHF